MPDTFTVLREGCTPCGIVEVQEGMFYQSPCIKTYLKHTFTIPATAIKIVLSDSCKDFPGQTYPGKKEYYPPLALAIA